MDEQVRARLKPIADEMIDVLTKQGFFLSMATPLYRSLSPIENLLSLLR
ncbi:MAG: hypothetical protein BWY07_02448 [Candidatus Hydrogenedentes bacterium ADurb.Bin170]|jgi:hypothetical protein|nr:MAG: hypothetical protein BWY07_02448 [Candidatus Hydrogenedentes bacterium ADurb.Bin170]